MKKVLLTLLLGLAPGVAFAQGAGLPAKALDPNLRARDFTIHSLIVGTASIAGTVNVEGVIASVDTNSASRPVLTSSIGQMPYPAAVAVEFFDGDGAGSTLVCTSVTIAGVDQYGVPRTEVLSSITETAVYSNHAYESVTSIRGVGCSAYSSGSISANDRLVVYASPRIGLRAPIRAKSDIISVCKMTAFAGTLACAKAADIPAAAVSLRYGTLNLALVNSAQDTDIPADFGLEESILTLRVRAATW